MKKIIFFLLMFILAILMIHADVYVKGIIHIEGGYRYGHNVPDLDVVYEWWFGKNWVTFSSTGWKLDFMSKDWRFTLDKTTERLLAINLTDSFYMEVPLTSDPSSIIEEWWSDRFLRHVIDGQVQRKGDEECTLEKKCDVFEVAEWIEEGDDHFYERDRTVKVSPDVPFDWGMINELYGWIRSFFNPHPGYVSSLKKISGFVLEEDVRMYELAGQMEWSFRVLEIVEKDAPSDVHKAPESYTKKELFSFRNLRDMLAIIYPKPIY